MFRSFLGKSFDPQLPGFSFPIIFPNSKLEIEAIVQMLELVLYLL
jgi:hypothetical protein